MKSKTCVFGQNFGLTVAFLLVALGLNGAPVAAQSERAPEIEKPAVSPLPPTTPPEIIKPVPLSELKNADAVFNRLDPGQRGYVTREETKDLIGFGDTFQAVDTKGSGKLTRQQFRKAWARYQQAVKE